MVKAQLILAAALVSTASAFSASPMKMSAAPTVSVDDPDAVGYR